MDAETINRHLRVWGTNPYGGPLVRVVWSDSQVERRFGEYNEFYGSIYLRTITGVREVPKYSWIRQRWILERWFPPELVYNKELPDSREGSYEPIYVFQDKHGNPLPLNLKVCELICSAMFNRPLSRGEIRESIESQLEEKERRELSELEEYFDISPIENALHMREAIIVPKEVK